MHQRMRDHGATLHIGREHAATSSHFWETQTVNVKVECKPPSRLLSGQARTIEQNITLEFFLVVGEVRNAAKESCPLLIEHPRPKAEIEINLPPTIPGLLTKGMRTRPVPLAQCNRKATRHVEMEYAHYNLFTNS